jgi:hypothetical protein
VEHLEEANNSFSLKCETRPDRLDYFATTDAMKKKSLNLVASFSRGPDKENSYYEDKIDELQERNL